MATSLTERSYMDTSCDDEWTPRAKCLGLQDMFELSNWPEPEEREGRERDEVFTAWIESQKAKFERAEEYCLDCPVFVQCWDSANKDDKEYTMRAGRWPTALAKADKFPTHICGRPSHIANQGPRTLPYCQKCVRDANRYRTSAATRERLARLKAERVANADPRFV